MRRGLSVLSGFLICAVAAQPESTSAKIIRGRSTFLFLILLLLLLLAALTGACLGVGFVFFGHELGQVVAYRLEFGVPGEVGPFERVFGFVVEFFAAGVVADVAPLFGADGVVVELKGGER